MTVPGGKFQRFEQFPNWSSIYWNSRVDPSRGRQIGGAIRDKWGNYDWETGPLGYPIESEMDVTNGGKINRFEGGLIYWSPATGAHPVWGQILQTWAALGYEQSAYGFPAGDEENWGAGKRQLFQNGQYIEWQPEGFEQDWEGDVNDNYITPAQCGNCGTDRRVDRFGPVRYSAPAARSAPGGTAQPDSVEELSVEPAIVPNEETGTDAPYCEDLTADPEAKSGAGVLCVFRNPPDVSELPPLPTTSSTTPAPGTTTKSTASSSTTTPAPSATTESTASSSTTMPAPSATTESATSSTTMPAPSATTQSATSSTTTPTPSAGAKSAVPSTITPAPSTTAESVRGILNFVGNRERGPVRTQAFPSKNYCQFGDPNFQYNDWAGDRMYQCRTKVHVIGMAEADTGNVTGYLYLEEKRTVELAWNNTAWDEAINVYAQNIVNTGNLATVKVEHQCSYGLFLNCYNDGGVSTLGPTAATLLATNGGKWTNDRKGAVAPGGGSVNARSTWKYTVTAPNFTTATFTGGYTRIIRCDAGVGLRSTQGCAYPEATPVMDYSVLSGLNDFRNHVSAAQTSGLPGSSDGSQLTRITDINLIRQNRAGSCGTVTGPRPSGMSCDEYPFAASDQGARNGGYGRAFNMCGIKDKDLGNDNVAPGTTGLPSGYSVCMIPRSQNSSAGAYLGWFFAKNRVMNGDGFIVLPN